jgi:flagellar hook protein FlgE
MLPENKLRHDVCFEAADKCFHRDTGALSMSIFASMDTAVLGINAQAAAIGHISDNVANASTNGYRQVSTAFSDLVTNKLLGASPVVDNNRNMGVLALADFNNRKNGQIVHDDSLSSFAVNGNGFIPVERATGRATDGTPSGFDSQVYYTRLGDFHMDNSNRLVNSAGYYLMATDAGGTTPSDFVVDTSDIDAVPTSTVNYTINLPPSAQTGRTITNGIGIIDATGVEQQFQVQWQKTGNNAWNMTVNTPSGTPTSFGPVAVTFANGVLSTMTSSDPNLSVTSTGSAIATLSTDFGSGAQAVTLNLGTFGGTFSTSNTSGLTQFATTDANESNVSVTQNGLKAGAFQNVSIREDGEIVYNYSNGRSQVGGQVLLANFPEPDRLDRLDGTVFIATSVSGDVAYDVPGGDNGSGLLVSSAVEQSNVDVAEQMTHLISAQQAYGLNSQVITASNEMLSRLVDMKQ